jgi:hypothetical protein
MTVRSQGNDFPRSQTTITASLMGIAERVMMLAEPVMMIARSLHGRLGACELVSARFLFIQEARRSNHECLIVAIESLMVVNQRQMTLHGWRNDVPRQRRAITERVMTMGEPVMMNVRLGNGGQSGCDHFPPGARSEVVCHHSGRDTQCGGQGAGGRIVRGVRCDVARR